MSRDVYILAAARSAIGGFGGSLAGLSPVELGVAVMRECLRRAGCADEQGAVVIAPQLAIVGNVLGAGHGMNVARQITLRSGCPVSTAAFAVNMVCGSGLQAVALAASAIQNGEADIVVAGGVESMSQAGHVSLGTRFGIGMGNSELRDLMIFDGLTDAFGQCHMGITAENIASRFHIRREDQDAFAVESQSRAEAAIKAGRFVDEVVPIPIRRKKETVLFAIDEHPRSGVTLDVLAKLRPAFKSDGTVTAGNASGINDGAAFCILASEAGRKQLARAPLAVVRGTAVGGVEPEYMGLGPVVAVRELFTRTGTTANDIDCFEANEAFAAQAIAVQQELRLNPVKVNPDGGAIALGHPIGASGARILVTLIHGLERRGEQRGIATLCVGGGQGVAVLIERTA